MIGFRLRNLSLALVLGLAGVCLMPSHTGASPAGLDDEGTIPAEESAEAVHPLASVAVIGASVSAGFGNHEELQVSRSPKLGQYLRAVFGEALGEGQVHDFGSSQFFTSPKTVGKRQIEKALEAQPTLVVGVDFLFWYAYGFSRPSNPRRMEGLLDGLKMLESFDCPMVIGDLPRVDHALRGSSPWRGGGPILRKSQLLSEAERAACNQVIHAWAAERDHVTVFPLAHLVDGMIQGKTMELHGNQWTVAKLSDAMQADLLHPRVRGMIWVALHVGDRMQTLPRLKETPMRSSESVVRDHLWQALEPEREKRKAKEEARAKRRAKAKEKAAAGER